MSHVKSSPSSGNSDANINALYPVKVPISKIFLHLFILTINFKKFPTESPDIIPDEGPRPRVSFLSSFSTSPPDSECVEI